VTINTKAPRLRDLARVDRVDHSQALRRRISWREAIARDSVGIVFNLISTVSTLLAIINLSASSWGHSRYEMAIQLSGAQPSWGGWAVTPAAVWFWGELLVLLFNKKKRALHDFIAGTVVVKLVSQPRHL
jgi:uncharacterized RDD family membrane protein YckC